MNALEKAISATGGLSKLADILKVSPQRVSNWLVRGVPVEFCPAIEKAAKGASTCEELCPGMDWGDRIYKPSSRRIKRTVTSGEG